MSGGGGGGGSDQQQKAQRRADSLRKAVKVAGKLGYLVAPPPSSSIRFLGRASFKCLLLVADEIACRLPAARGPSRRTRPNLSAGRALNGDRIDKS